MGQLEFKRIVKAFLKLEDQVSIAPRGVSNPSAVSFALTNCDRVNAAISP
jgi:hypothetical protein